MWLRRAGLLFAAVRDHVGAPRPLARPASRSDVRPSPAPLAASEMARAPPAARALEDASRGRSSRARGGPRHSRPDVQRRIRSGSNRELSTSRQRARHSRTDEFSAKLDASDQYIDVMGEGGLSTQRSAGTSDLRERARAHFVGRQSERKRLARTLAAADGVEPHVVLLRGEAGVGKTTLPPFTSEELTKAIVARGLPLSTPRRSRGDARRAHSRSRSSPSTSPAPVRCRRRSRRKTRGSSCHRRSCGTRPPLRRLPHSGRCRCRGLSTSSSFERCSASTTRRRFIAS